MPNTTDTVKAILTPGEFVIRKEAVDMIGVPTLEKLNDMPEAGGHSEIDRLIAQATLKNMTGMYGGGMVNAEQYGHGGMVNKYEDGGQAMSNLKPVPDNNPGLGKLPEGVRNKMGYMQNGGSVDSIYNLNDLKKLMPMKASNLMGTFDEDQAKVVRKIISGLNISDEERSMLTPEMEKPMGLPTEIQSELLRKIISGDSLSTEEQQNFTPRMSPLGMQNGGLMEMMHGGKAKKKKEMYSYEDGGAVQEDAMMRDYQMNRAGMEFRKNQAEQANPFVPFDQRPNQAPATGNWGQSGDYMNSLKGELEMENEELTRDKMQNFLERLRLDSLSEKIRLDPSSERIERSPQDSMYYRNTPQQDYFMNKYREEMINPNYFPEGN